MRVRGNGWPRALAAVVIWAAAPPGRPARALPWASPPAPAAQPQQPAAQPGAPKPVAAAPALGKGPDKQGVVAPYCIPRQPGRARPAAWPGSPAGALAGAGCANEDVLRHAANRGRHTAAAAGP